MNLSIMSSKVPLYIMQRYHKFKFHLHFHLLIKLYYLEEQSVEVVYEHSNFIT